MQTQNSELYNENNFLRLVETSDENGNTKRSLYFTDFLLSDDIGTITPQTWCQRNICNLIFAVIQVCKKIDKQ